MTRSLGGARGSHPGGGIRGRCVAATQALVIALGVVGAAPARIQAQEPVSVTFAQSSDDELATDAALAVEDGLPTPPVDAVDLTPLAQLLADDLASLPLERTDVAALAAALGPDPGAAFAFVRDRIGFDPYPGLLRGPAGTLIARAGNAPDRAALLAALLDAMGTPVRYARAPLGAEALALVTERAMATGPESPDSAMDGVERGIAARSIDLATVERRARRDHALLRGALGDRLGGAAIADASTLATTLAQHTWVQAQIDGTWVDLDPTLPDATWGVPLASAVTTFDAIPEVDRQWVMLRVVAETLVDGMLTEVVALERRLDVAMVASEPIALTFAPAGGGGLLGGTEAVTGYTPVLSIGDRSEVGIAIPVATEGGGFSDLGGFGGGESVADVVSVRLEVVRGAPGLLPDLRTRVLLDRVPPDVRAAGAITAESLSPLVLVDELPVPFAQLHQIALSTGGGDARGQLIDVLNATYTAEQAAGAGLPEGTGLGTLLRPLAALAGSLRLASERLIVPALEDEAVRAFVGRPRVTIVSMGPPPTEPAAVRLQVDLLVDDVTVIERPGSVPGTAAARRGWYGALEAALESEWMRQLAVMSNDPTRTVDAPSFAMHEPLTVIDPRDASTVPAELPSALRAALDEGLVVVAPGDPSTAGAWWTVSPRDGATRAILDPGLGGAEMWIRVGDYMKMVGGTIWVARDLWLAGAACAPSQESETITRCVGIGSIAILAKTYGPVIIAGLVVGVALGIGVLYLASP